ncbi:DNA polymerase III subunit chi [Chitinasiproducens palmae]|uniref:DNA polymerase III, chi subunit n=1 Tax=Chitinasiproducens palmae TaxID=1770053 RepID=A0A1H2PPX5_9BURK|nr:DNA polymerase III subunit chi [Chitinasiproducens palmae]SDV48014.1 DNA polymerase III, chi subunit [Chitinasiproducens palmae]
MTRVDFHTRVADPLAYACRLVRKAYTAGKPVAVVGNPDTLARLDGLLWTFSPLDFIPHCGADAPGAAETPVVLCTNGAASPHQGVLLNLGDDVPPQFARFERLLEVVGDQPEQLAAGRERYRFYRDRGYAITNH